MKVEIDTDQLARLMCKCEDCLIHNISAYEYLEQLEMDIHETVRIAAFDAQGGNP